MANDDQDLLDFVRDFFPNQQDLPSEEVEQLYHEAVGDIPVVPPAAQDVEPPVGPPVPLPQFRYGGKPKNLRFPSLAFSTNYGFSQIKVGLMFIPIGVGSVLSAFTTGRLVDWNYRRWCSKLNVPVVKNRKTDLTNFPIERARLEVVLPLFFVAVAFIIAYGWVLTKKISVAVPVVLLFFTGYSLTSSFQVLNVLMVDIYPGKPSVATAANNFVRCEIGAVFSAILLPLVDSIGWGWAYTLLALLFVGFVPMLLFVMQRGPRWRKERKAREDKARAGRQERRDLKIAEKERRANGGSRA